MKKKIITELQNYLNIMESNEWVIFVYIAHRNNKYKVIYDHD